VTGRLEDRVALITGAARGQGRAHAVRMAREGADLIAVDIAGPLPASVRYDSATPEDLKETVRLAEANGARVVSVVADTREVTELRRAVDEGVRELGRLDVVVANAGICVPSAWHDITPESFRDVIDTNVFGTWNTVMAGAQHIIDGERGGSIVLISSFAGAKVQPFMVDYTASKHAVTGMARAFAAELGRHNIRVNSVHPGPVSTPMTGEGMVAALLAAMETNSALGGMMTPFLPAYWAEPEDIADAVCWLASDESRMVTGVALSVDQGMAQF
jgi:SDR family mycofactocin-dependent oxidoreductase